MSASEAKQRLVDLDVGEVSIVDVPANEVPFVVTKAKVAASANPETAMAGVTLDPAIAACITFDYLQNMMYEAGKKLRDGKRDEAMAEMERITAMLDQVKAFTASVSKSASEITAQVEKAKGDDKGKKVPAFMKEALKGVIDTLKAAMGPEDDDNVDGGKDEANEVKAAKALDGALEAVAKAGKAQFSKERLAKLAEAFGHMGSMYKEADAAGFQKAIEQWTAKPADAQTDSGSATEGGGKTGNASDAKPATPANGSAVKSGDSPAGAGAEAPAWFSSAIAGMQKSIEDIKKSAEESTATVTKRLEAVEKVEAVSKALSEDRDDNVNKVQKGKQPSIFKGLV